MAVIELDGGYLQLIFAQNTPFERFFRGNESEIALFADVEADILRDTRPTVFLYYPDTPFHEQVLITLFYADGSEKKYSLWEMDNSTLYEGDAEDLTMSCMLDAGIHYAGKVDAAMQEFLQQISKLPKEVWRSDYEPKSNGM